MKVLVYGFSGNKGGKEEYMMNLNDISIKNNIYFDYIVNGDKCFYLNKIIDYNENVYYLNKKNIFSKIWEIYKIIKKNHLKYEYLYFNTSGLYFIFPIIFARIFGMKIIIHAHSAKEPRLNILLFILNMINRCYVNKSASLKFQCSDLAGKWIFGRNKERRFQINNGIDLKKYEFNYRIRKKIRKDLQIDDNEFVLINVGRMQFPKNQKFLIDLVLNMKNKYKLLLVGDGDDYNQLTKYVRKHNASNIVFLGNRNDVSDLLQASDLFLMPSFFEGFPIAAVEAQASGLKCILSDAITKQINITGSVKFLPINNQQIWQDEILNIQSYDRKKNYNYLKDSKFDIEDSLTYVLDLMLSGGEYND